MKYNCSKCNKIIDGLEIYQIIINNKMVFVCNDCYSQLSRPNKMSDNINPKHYTDLKIEPINFITENNLSYCIGNVIKYVSRYQNKNGIEDLKKAMWYLQKQIEIEENR